MITQKVIRLSTVPISLNILLKGQLKFLSQYYDILAVSGEGEHLEEVRMREGVRVYPISMNREISIVMDFSSFLKLFLLFRKEKPQIVHSITPKAGLLGMAAAYFAGVPVRIHTFTGLIFPTRNGLMRRILLYMDKLLCCFATHVYPEGEGVKNDLVRYRITDKPLKILANGNVNGIDTKYFDPLLFDIYQKQQLRSELFILPNDFVFIYVGRIVKDKGINELVEAFDNCNKQHTNIKLILVGDAADETDKLTPATLELLKFNNNIISVGFQHDIRPYLSISQVLVLASYREGFPNVVMQAGSMGVPCIVTDINGSNEIIREDVNGIIVPPKSANSILQAMKFMIEKPKWRLKMQEQARDMICSRYQQSLVWNALKEEYNNILADV